MPDSKYLEVLRGALSKRKKIFEAAIMNNTEFDELKELKTEIKLLEKEIAELCPARSERNPKQKSND